MVRHPHFTQPIFVRFPRPAVMQGREGTERYPQAGEITLDMAVYRSLRPLDPGISLGWVQDVTALYTESEVLKARHATLLAKPQDVKAYFAAQFRKIIPLEQPLKKSAPALRTPPIDDPYGF